MVFAEMFLHILLTHIFVFVLGRCYAYLCQWQMLFSGRYYMPYRNVADVIAKR